MFAIYSNKKNDIIIRLSHFKPLDNYFNTFSNKKINYIYL